ncbi:MAG: efflux RND transporter periplasmic adaptor subunit [Planctomycetaceae bacterium]
MNSTPSSEISHSQVRGGRVLITLVAAVVILVLGGAAFVALARLKREPEQRPPVEKVYNVDVFPVSPTNLPVHIAGHGTAVPEKDVVLSAEVGGQILSLNANGRPRTNPKEQEKLLKVGQVVRAGELLFLIDATSYQQRLDQANLQIEADKKEYALLKKQQANSRKLVAQARQDKAEYKKEYDRYLAAKAKGAAVDGELTRVKLELQRYNNLLTVAENKQALFPLQLAQIEVRQRQHEKDRDIAQTELERTRIRAKFTGVISEVNVQPGRFVRVGDPLLRISSAAVVEIPVSLSLDDFLRIEPHIRKAKTLAEKPRVELAESEEKPYQWIGRVVRSAPWGDELTRTVQVFIRVHNPDPSKTATKNDPDSHPSNDPVLPGMHYFGNIIGAGVDNVLVVPRDAIIDGSVFVATDLKRRTMAAGKQQRTVWEGVAKSRKVKIVETQRTLAVVEGELRDGDRVILTNLDVLHNKAKVRFAESQVRSVADELPRRRFAP